MTEILLSCQLVWMHKIVYGESPLPIDKSSLTPEGPMSVDGFLGSSGRLSWRQKHERRSEILKEGRPM
jgi:hypothetical protein